MGSSAETPLLTTVHIATGALLIINMQKKKKSMGIHEKNVTKVN